MDKHFVINIGRELGSGGKEIGEKLAQKLNIAFYDKELINIASKESGLCPDFFERADEEASQFPFSGLFNSRFSFFSEGALMGANYLSNDALFKIQSDVIRNIADKESAIFVGRCADYILREHPCAINLFITAPLNARVQRVKETMHFTDEEAERFIEKHDRKRSTYYNYYTYKEWGHASSYHLCIDSSLLDIDEIVDFLADFIRKRLEKVGMI